MKASAPNSAAFARPLHHLLEHAPPVQRGHHEVEEHELGVMLLDGGQGLPAVTRGIRRVPLGLQAELEHPYDLRLVVNDEDAGAESRLVDHGRELTGKAAHPESVARAVSGMVTRT